VLETNANNWMQIRPFIRPSNSVKYFSPEEVAKLLKKSDNWTLTGAALLRRDYLLSAGLLDTELGSSADGIILRKLAFIHGFAFVPINGLTWRRNNEGYSASTLLNKNLFKSQIELCVKKITEDKVFPDWYAKKYFNRMKFSQKSYVASKNKNALLNFLYLLINFIRYRPFSLQQLIHTTYGRYFKA
jgi:hypothetical protein